MPIHIDQIETELEIVPSPVDEAGAPAASGAPPAPRISAARMRRMVMDALEEELQDYLRGRG